MVKTSYVVAQCRYHQAGKRRNKRKDQNEILGYVSHYVVGFNPTFSPNLADALHFRPEKFPVRDDGQCAAKLHAHRVRNALNRSIVATCASVAKGGKLTVDSDRHVMVVGDRLPQHIYVCFKVETEN